MKQLFMKRLFISACIGLIALCFCACGNSTAVEPSAEETSAIAASEAAAEAAASTPAPEAAVSPAATVAPAAEESVSESSPAAEAAAMTPEPEAAAAETTTAENAAAETTTAAEAVGESSAAAEPAAAEPVAEEPAETTPEVDPSTVIPENPDYDGIYGTIYNEVVGSGTLSDYAKVYFVDSNGDGVMEMWIETGSIEETDVYTIRESGAVLIDTIEGGIPYEDILSFDSMGEHRWHDALFQTPWPGWDEVMESWFDF